MLTDGISEVHNERDEEFGLARLEHLVTQYAGQPLPDIWELIMEQVHQHELRIKSKQIAGSKPPSFELKWKRL
jgi:serine phosphatase RsbU (regulator of sigma subunit)